MRKAFVCIVCDYRYDPAGNSVAEEISADNPPTTLPRDWKCPECGAGKSCFIETRLNDINETVCE